MLLLATASLAADVTFTCPALSAPADARPVFDTDVSAPGEAAWDELEAWYDASCVTSCTGSSDAVTSCEEASCVTAAGATFTWSEVVTRYTDYGWEQTTVATITVIPPASAGLDWTSASAERRLYEYSFGFSETSSTTYDVSWVGTLDAAWPVDGSFESYDDTSVDSSSLLTYARRDWASSACVWSVADEGAYGYEDITVEVSGEPDTELTWGEDFGSCDTESNPWRAVFDGADYGLVDGTTWERDGDADGDGFGTTDCDDTDADVNPCAVEVAGDGVDSDCDGAEDVDGDGGVSEAEGGDDCDDGDATVYVGATEVPYDGIDQDCDGADLVDADGDGHEGADDCDDVDATVYTGATEILCDGVDQDCDGGDACDTGGGDTATDTDTGAPPPPEETGCGSRAALLPAGFLLLALRRRRRRTSSAKASALTEAFARAQA